MYDVVVIGAGPSGAVASALLSNKGYKVLVLERQEFPRFSIGESLLPHCMEFLREAGLDKAVADAGFQYKNGAVFQHQGNYSEFDFREKFSPGPGETFQVQRAHFDKVLADAAAALGVDIRYRHQVETVDLGAEAPVIHYTDAAGEQSQVQARYILDASGFGRVLPRLLDLEQPSDFPVRASLFCHVEDGITSEKYDRDKILISVNPKQRDVWYWLIPFANGVSSVGVVAEPRLLESYPDNLDDRLKALIKEDPELRSLLENANWNVPVRQITGYSAGVKQLATDQYALLGNAGEFLDPVFSSGVTIALRSASMAADTLHRQLQGESVDWQRDYALPLKKGVDTFRAFVTAWYDGRFQDVIFYEQKSDDIKRMISSILAGYAWDDKNPYVKSPNKRLDSLYRYCRSNLV